MMSIIRVLAIAGVSAALLITASIESKGLDKASWQKQIVMHIRDNFIYPRSAIRRGVQGQAQIEVTIGRDGTILKHEVIKASGEKALDRTIDKIVNKMNPMPAPPSDMEGEEITFTIPLTWRLG